MKKCLIIALLGVSAVVCAAQTNRFPPINLYTGDPTGNACTGNLIQQSNTTGLIYTCQGGTMKTGASSGSGTVSGQTNGKIPLATGATTVGAPSHLDDGLTTPATITATEPIAGPSAAFSGSMTASTAVPALQPVADVTNPTYGAKGDGSTNDVPAIQSAVNAVAALGGGRVFLPRGTFRLASTSPIKTQFGINIQGSHVHIVCDPETVIDASGLTVAGGVGSIFGFGYPTAAMGTGVQNDTGYQANVLPLPGSATITLTTPSDTSHFAVGDAIYILGGPSIESNGDGEIDWVTAINAGTGVLSLRVPTSKPYTGNNSNVGAPGIVTVIPGVDHSQSPAVDKFFYDDSVEGCTVINAQVDFTFFGQIIHGKMLNNHVEIIPSATRGMGLNSYYPMADIEVAGNYYVQGQMWFSQLADGFRDIDIHDNTFVSANGWSVLDVSQGVVGTRVHHNKFNVVMPASVASSNAAILFSTAYGYIMDGNIINMSTLSGNTLVSGVVLGQSNGVCRDCVVSNNIIRFTGPSASGQSAIYDFGSNATITGNHIFVNGARFGIRVFPHGTADYANSTIVGNIIHSYNEVAGYGAIQVADGGIVSPSSEIVINSNQIFGSGGANGTGVLFLAKGGGIVNGNEIYNLPTGIDLGGTGTPLLMANECTNVTTTTNCGSPGFAQTAVNNTFSGANTFTGSNTFTTGTQDFHTSAHTLPSKSGTIASLPGTCTVGEEYFATDATPGSNKYGCTSTNVWTAIGSGAGLVTTAPSWLQFLGDGSEGSSTCSGTLANSGEHWYSSFTVNAGATCVGSARSTVIRVNGPCTINGTLDVSAVGVATTSIPSYGGSGGGGGGGTGAGVAGSGTLTVPGGSGTGSVTVATFGAAGTATGGAGGAGNAVTAAFQKAASSQGIAGGYGWGGAGGGAGGSSGGAAGNGGENLVLACSSINFGASNLIDASGGPGQPSTANNVGSGGGGGGGVVVIRSSNITGTPTVNVNGGPGGSCAVPMAQWSGGGGVGLTTTATVAAGVISACSVGGTTTGFNSAPKCTIVGGGGTLGTCHFTFSTGTVTGCVVDTAGSGYTQSTFTTCGAGGAGGAGWSKTISN